MWIMTSYGILMPAALPSEVEELINRGQPSAVGADYVMQTTWWDMQVRGRDRKTLEAARRSTQRFGRCSKVISTPRLDYDFRFYCNREDFAAAMAEEITEITYEKFKPTTEEPGGGGPHLHRLYNKIWSVVFDHYDRTTTRRGKLVKQPRHWWEDK